MQKARSQHIIIEKGIHRNIQVIWLNFTNRKDWLTTIKELREIRFSKTKGAWYLPYNKIAWNNFLRLKLPYSTGTHEEMNKHSEGVPTPEHDKAGISIDQNGESVSPSLGKEVADIHEKSGLDISWSAMGFFINIDYSKDSVDFVKTLEGAWWNARYKNWICKSTLSNLEKLQSHWNFWNQEDFDLLYVNISKLQNPCKIILYYLPKYPSKVCIELIGYGANHDIVKRISGRNYDKEGKYYTIGYNRKSIDQIIEMYKEIGYTIDNRLSNFNSKETIKSVSEKINYYLNKFPKSQYSCLHQYTSMMLRLNYGYRTIRDYTAKISRILTYTGENDMNKIKADQVNKYMALMANKNVSYSLLNTIYSAVKLYHDQISFSEDFEMGQLKRPRTPSKLPVFLSEKEVLMIFDKIQNIKHLAIVYLLYGSGLRRSEVLNLKLDHIFWDRDQLLIVNGKGKKDRMVNLSRTCKEILEVYFQEYKPVQYLFESTEPGKAYSSTSLASFIKKATKAAGITKRVTPHVLRHSFATHLMDNGVAMPKIQKLLGHKDIKTTMIYTHLTKKSIAEVESPLDILIKKHNSANEK